MIGINLLSPEQRKIIQAKRTYSLIKESVLLILLFTLLISFLLVIAKSFLEQQLINVTEKNAMQEQNAELHNQEINTINKQINSAKAIQSQYYNDTKILAKLSTIIPADINLKTITVRKQTKEIELSGTALNRNALIEFKKILNDSGFISQVALPNSDLLSQEKNSFTIKAKINLDEFHG